MSKDDDEIDIAVTAIEDLLLRTISPKKHKAVLSKAVAIEKARREKWKKHENHRIDDSKLQIPERIRRALLEDNVLTVGQVLDLGENALLRFPNVAKVSVIKLKQEFWTRFGIEISEHGRVHAHIFAASVRHQEYDPGSLTSETRVAKMRARIEDELRNNAARSNREIGRLCGAHGTAVVAVRKRLGLQPEME